MTKLGGTHGREPDDLSDSAFEGDSENQLKRPRFVSLIACIQFVILALFILPSWFSFTPERADTYASVSNLLCLGLIAICLSAFCLARGGAESLFDSLFPFVLGATSLITPSYWSMVSVVSGHVGLDDQWAIMERWFVLVTVLLVMLVVFTFGRQMLRLNRTNVIYGLARSLVSGFVCISLSGWIFMPDLAAHYASGLIGGVRNTVGRSLLAVAVLALAIIIALCIASWAWWAELDRMSGYMVHTWLVITLIPIMLSGAVVVSTLVVVRCLLY